MNTIPTEQIALEDSSAYDALHQQRIQHTIDILRRLGASRVIELGGHPWVMTKGLLESSLEVVATVSAEEELLWPDELPLRVSKKVLTLDSGAQAQFTNYSANLERTRFSISEPADTVVACEIIEHLVRSPHVMLLNANEWLPIGGNLLVTTPNGLHFQNPFRRKPRMNAFRAHIYERHTYLFSLAHLVELIELCGFEVVWAGYWNEYQRSGASRVYDLMRMVPGAWFRDRFSRTCAVLARKTGSIKSLQKVPACYDQSTDWEYIDSSS